jgi:hypothetical protein
MAKATSIKNSVPTTITRNPSSSQLPETKNTPLLPKAPQSSYRTLKKATPSLQELNSGDTYASFARIDSQLPAQTLQLPASVIRDVSLVASIESKVETPALLLRAGVAKEQVLASLGGGASNSPGGAVRSENDDKSTPVSSDASGSAVSSDNKTVDEWIEKVNNTSLDAFMPSPRRPRLADQLVSDLKHPDKMLPEMVASGALYRSRALMLRDFSGSKKVHDVLEKALNDQDVTIRHNSAAAEWAANVPSTYLEKYPKNAIRDLLRNIDGRTTNFWASKAKYQDITELKRVLEYVIQTDALSADKIASLLNGLKKIPRIDKLPPNNIFRAVHKFLAQKPQG